MVVLGVGACGGGGGGQRLTRAAYDERGNAICATTLQRVSDAGPSAFPEVGQTPSAQRVEAFVNNTLGPELKKERDSLKALKPPSDDQSRVNEMLDKLKQATDSVTSDPTIIVSRDNDPFVRFDTLANDFGLTTCSQVDTKARSLTTGLRTS